MSFGCNPSAPIFSYCVVALMHCIILLALTLILSIIICAMELIAQTHTRTHFISDRKNSAMNSMEYRSIRMMRSFVCQITVIWVAAEQEINVSCTHNFVHIIFCRFCCPFLQVFFWATFSLCQHFSNILVCERVFTSVTRWTFGRFMIIAIGYIARLN